MHAAQASEWGCPRRHHQHHHHHHRGPRGLEDLIALMTGGRGGPWGDPRQFKAMMWGPTHPGPGGPGGPGRGGWGGRGRGGRARRGDVRAAMLLLLEEQPQNGYQLIQEIERRTEGVWKPSPGSVYPALQQLEDEGLVQAAESEGKRAYDLTAEGRDYVANSREELGNPFEAATFALPDATTVLVSHLTTYDAGHRPVEHSRFAWPADAARISAEYSYPAGTDGEPQ